MFKKVLKKIGVLLVVLCMLFSVGNMTASAAVKVKAPTSVSAKLVTKTKSKISWKKVSGAKKYQVYYSVNGGSFRLLKTVSKTSYIQSNLKAGRTYRYRVRAIKGSSKSVWSATKSVKTVPAGKVKVTTKVSGTNVTVKWKSVKNATGYFVYRRSVSGSYKKIGSTKSLSYKDSSLTQLNKKYVYKVVAYVKSAGKTFSGAYGTKVVTTAKSAYLMDLMRPYSTSYYYYEYTDGNIFTSGGNSYSKGFAVSDYRGKAAFNVGGAYKTLSFTAGHIDGGEKVDTYVQVYCDDVLVKEVWMAPDDLPKKITVNLKGVNKLELVALQNTGGRWFNSGSRWGFGNIKISK